MIKMIRQLIWLILSILIIVGCQKEAATPRLKPLFADDVILAFGDSLTFGQGASTPDESYPQVLQTLIQHPVVNAGIPGEETKDGLKRLPEILDQYTPALVLLCFGGNDLLRKRQPDQIKTNLKRMVQIILQHQAQVLIIAVPEPKFSLLAPAFYKEVGEEMNVPVDNDTLPSLFSNQAYKSDYIHFNDAGYRAFASAIAARLQKLGALGFRSHQ